MKRANSIVAIMLVLIILLMIFAPVIAVNPPSQNIYINSVDDLYQLSQDCSFDRWSQGRTVVLNADIDLKGEAFTPIPIFGGTFDGNGYTIRGLSIIVEGSNQGLFRYLQEGAVIKNLNVEGAVTPGGEKSSIGGIVGYNNGVLENCSFSGYIKGRNTVGGLVGWNSTSGMIINSSFKGLIYGESKVGGITGYNAGIVLRCSNDSSVNTTVEELKLDFKDLTVEDINYSKIFYDSTDIGGIAGVNTGIVKNSKNGGIVGYPHVGYNIGGLVGRQTGYIENCLNYGTVYGRKEVGGIVGQMEPHVNMMIQPSKLKQLHNEMNALQFSITRMINNTRLSSDLMTQNLTLIQDDISKGKVHIQSLVDQVELLINKDIEEINRISITAIEAIDRLIPITDLLANTIEIMDESIPLVKKSMTLLSRAMGEMSEFTEEYIRLSDSLETFVGEMEEAVIKIKKAYLDIVKVLELLRKWATDLTLTKMLEESQKDEILILLKSAWDNLKGAGEKMQNSIENLKSTGRYVSQMIMSIGDLSGYMEDALIYMVEAMDVMEQAEDDIGGIFDEINNLLTYLSEQPELKFQTTNDMYQKTKEDLFGSIDDMSASLSKFINTMNAQGNIMMDDLQTISDQLFRVMNLMFSIIEEISIGEIDAEKMVKDVSRDDIDRYAEGKVTDCRNFGTIEGDINVGGIAGAMSIDLEFDPEEDLNISGKLSINTVYQTRAIIKKCENNGTIISKKNNAGGIVGNMDIGYIKDCISVGTVKSTDGNYVGGIAGKSNVPIVSSFAKCELDGGNYIGGIAGYGMEITDCYTLVKVNRYKACVGAIAGDIDKNSVIRRNYFVSDILRGIDGISYADKAEPIAYEMLASIEDIPSIFKEFRLTFWADDRLVKTIDFNYGDSIFQEEIPEVPIKEGYHGKWEDFKTSNLTFDTKIQAEYIPYMTILESKEKRNGTMSIVLVEGRFTEQEYVTLIQDDKIDITLLDEGKLLEQWSVIIPEDEEDTHIIRYLPPSAKKSLKIYILNDGKWTKTKFQWDSKYLVFESSGNTISFILVDAGSYFERYWILAGLLLMGGAIIMVRFGYKKKVTEGKQEEEASYRSL